MTTVSSTSASTGLAASNTMNTKPANQNATNANEAADRFLKLLVTQMQNQDPLNPMDNAQVTSQMAQINTVNGIEKLNTAMVGMSDHLLQSQIIQGAALVGKSVLTSGHDLLVDSQGVAHSAFELNANATGVKVDVLNGAGNLIDSIDMGSQSQGLHAFNWTPPKESAADNFTFKVTATAGNSTVPATLYSQDQINAISTAADHSLVLELRNGGPVAYNKVRAIG